jgi:hypothetical protein
MMTIQLYDRGANGRPIGQVGKIENDSYPDIPLVTIFQGSQYTPRTIHGWQFSETFKRWSALVTHQNGWHGFDWPVK